MDTDMIGTVMLGMVIIGLGLSVYQLIAEVVGRGRRAAVTASKDEVMRRLYTRPSPKA